MNDRNAVLEEHANGVSYRGRFYPYHIVAGYGSAAGQSTSPASSSTRFFIKRVFSVQRNVAADTNTEVYFTVTVNGKSNDVPIHEFVPSVACSDRVQFDCNLLCDPGTAIVTKSSDNVYTAGWVSYLVAEIDDV